VSRARLVALVVAGAGCAAGTGGATGPDAGPADAAAAAAERPDVDPIAASMHLALGLPTDGDASDDVLLDHRYFVVSYNPRRRVPNWVAWRLEAADLGPAVRKDDFHPDQLLPPPLYRVGPDDYRGSGFDRGHMCPSADRTSTPEANSATFVMTNMQPQRHELNAGPWEELETFERQLATQNRRVFIVAGGLFDAAPATIGPAIAVPRANYKILVVLGPGEGAAAVDASTRVYAVVMPNATTAATTHWPQYLATVDEIERDSGYDFLTAVPAAVADPLEARTAPPP
jgi:endonuclease G